MTQQIEKAIEVMQREYEDAQRSYNNAKMYGTHEIIVKNEGIVFAYETALSALRSQLKRQQGCEYICQDDDCGTWECSECHAVWNLDAGTPIDNNMRFCPECGLPVKAIITRAYVEELDSYIDERTEMPPCELEG